MFRSVEDYSRKFICSPDNNHFFPWPCLLWGLGPHSTSLTLQSLWTFLSIFTAAPHWYWTTCRKPKLLPLMIMQNNLVLASSSLQIMLKVSNWGSRRTVNVLYSTCCRVMPWESSCGFIVNLCRFLNCSWYKLNLPFPIPHFISFSLILSLPPCVLSCKAFLGEVREGIHSVVPLLYHLWLHLFKVLVK